MLFQNPLKSFRLLAVLLGLTIFLPFEAYSSHLRAGEITARRINCSLEYEICITVFTNTATTIRFGDGVLDFGDGTFFSPPQIENTERPDLGPNIATVKFCIRHTFPGLAQYKISYLEQNRNGGILNMFDSFNTVFFIESVIKYSVPINLLFIMCTIYFYNTFVF